MTDQLQRQLQDEDKVLAEVVEEEGKVWDSEAEEMGVRQRDDKNLNSKDSNFFLFFVK